MFDKNMTFALKNMKYQRMYTKPILNIMLTFVSQTFIYSFLNMKILAPKSFNIKRVLHSKCLFDVLLTILAHECGALGCCIIHITVPADRVW